MPSNRLVLEIVQRLLSIPQLKDKRVVVLGRSLDIPLPTSWSYLIPLDIDTDLIQKNIKLNNLPNSTYITIAHKSQSVNHNFYCFIAFAFSLPVQKIGMKV